MKKILFVFLFVSIFLSCCLAQADTSKLSWERVLYEVFNTKQDSLNFDFYADYKEPFFEAYFNNFSPEVLDSIMKHCHNVTWNTVADSMKYSEYVAKVEPCWNLTQMAMRLGIKKIRKEGGFVRETEPVLRKE